MKKLSEKQRIIQDQANLIKEKEKDSMKLLAAEENLKWKKGAYSYLVKRLKGC